MDIKELLTLHEGLELKAYKCTAGKITIGVGRNVEELGIAVNAIVQDNINFAVREAGIDRVSFNTSFIQLIHLVFHQCN